MSENIEKTVNKIKIAQILINKKAKCLFVKNVNNNDIFDKIKNIEKSYWQKEKKKWKINGTNKNYIEVKKILAKAGYKIKIEYKKHL